jgi:hypothetical protein
VGEAARTAMDSAHEVVQKYHPKRRFDCEQQDKFFQPFEIGDIVWVENRGAPADGLKKKHMLGHNGPIQVVGVQGDLSYPVGNVTTRKQDRVHFLHICPLCQ